MTLTLRLCLLAASLCAVAANYEHTCSLTTRERGAHRLGVCGDALARMMSVVCLYRGYNGKWYRNKRSTSSVSAIQTPAAPVSVGEKLRGVLLNKEEALSYLHKRSARRERRGRTYGTQGITCECCYNSCNWQELSQYCSR